MNETNRQDMEEIQIQLETKNILIEERKLSGPINAQFISLNYLWQIIEDEANRSIWYVIKMYSFLQGKGFKVLARSSSIQALQSVQGFNILPPISFS